VERDDGVRARRGMGLSGGKEAPSRRSAREVGPRARWCQTTSLSPSVSISKRTTNLRRDAPRKERGHPPRVIPLATSIRWAKSSARACCKRHAPFPFASAGNLSYTSCPICLSRCQEMFMVICCGNAERDRRKAISGHSGPPADADDGDGEQNGRMTEGTRSRK